VTIQQKKPSFKVVLNVILELAYQLSCHW